MPKVDLYNVSGKVIGDIELKDEVFNAEINKDAMYLNYLFELAELHRLGKEGRKDYS